MDKTELLARLEPHGQEHLLHYWDDLSREFRVGAGAVTAVAWHAGRTWIGTEEGLLAAEADAKEVLRLPGTLARRPVTALLAHDSSLYVGTRRGLLAYDTKQRTVAELLGEAHVTTLLAAPAGLLVGTRQGLAYVPGDGAPAVLDTRCQGRHVSALAADGEHLWIATLGHGLTRAANPFAE